MNDLKFTTAGNYMDSKIEDLMYQSGLTSSGCWDEMDSYDKEAIEKFGELIIKECASLFDKDEIELTLTERTIHNMIKEHFEIKET